MLNEEVNDELDSVFVWVYRTTASVYLKIRYPNTHVIDSNLIVCGQTKQLPHQCTQLYSL